MAKYGSAAGKRVKSAMHRKKKGTLKSGSATSGMNAADLMQFGNTLQRNFGKRAFRRSLITPRRK